MLTLFGVVVVVVLLLNLSSGKNSQIAVYFLGVILLSMILLNWKQIKPYFIKET